MRRYIMKVGKGEGKKRRKKSPQKMPKVRILAHTDC